MKHHNSSLSFLALVKHNQLLWNQRKDWDILHKLSLTKVGMPIVKCSVTKECDGIYSHIVLTKDDILKLSSDPFKEIKWYKFYKA